MDQSPENSPLIGSKLGYISSMILGAMSGLVQSSTSLEFGTLVEIGSVIANTAICQRLRKDNPYYGHNMFIDFAQIIRQNTIFTGFRIATIVLSDQLQMHHAYSFILSTFAASIFAYAAYKDSQPH